MEVTLKPASPGVTNINGKQMFHGNVTVVMDGVTMVNGRPTDSTYSKMQTDIGNLLTAAVNLSDADLNTLKATAPSPEIAEFFAFVGICRRACKPGEFTTTITIA